MLSQQNNKITFPSTNTIFGKNECIKVICLISQISRQQVFMELFKFTFFLCMLAQQHRLKGQKSQERTFVQMQNTVNKSNIDF